MLGYSTNFRRQKVGFVLFSFHTGWHSRSDPTNIYDAAVKLAKSVFDVAVCFISVLLVLGEGDLPLPSKRDNPSTENQEIGQSPAMFRLVISKISKDSSSTEPKMYRSNTLSLPSSKSAFSQPFKEKCISDVVRSGSVIICHTCKLWKAKFFILGDAIFLVRLQGKFEIDHS